MKKIIKIIVGIILISIAGIIGFKLYVKHNLKQQQVAVLVYHNIVLNEEDKNGDKDCLTTEEFEIQMKYLKESGYQTITANDFYEWKENKKEIPEKSVLITFDDGFYSFKYLVQPILEKYNYNALCFLIGSYTQDTTKEYNPKEYGTIGKDEVIVHKPNLEYGSHTYAIHDVNKNNEKLINVKTREELKEDIETFNSEIFEAKYLAYPFYTYKEDMIKELKKHGYLLAFAGEEEMAIKNVNNYKIPRISGVKSMEEFKKVFETNEYKNKYGNGLIRKVCIRVERFKKVMSDNIIVKNRENNF